MNVSLLAGATLSIGIVVVVAIAVGRCCAAGMRARAQHRYECAAAIEATREPPYPGAFRRDPHTGTLVEPEEE